MISTLFLFLLVAASAQISDDVLQQIWDERPDLQSRFPKVGLGEYDKMMQWAIDEGWNQDSRLKQLVPNGVTPDYLIEPQFPISNELLKEIWDTRPDLQSKFPEVESNNYDSLIQWAKTEGWDQDVRLVVLVPSDTLPEYLLQNYYLMATGLLIIGVILSGFVKLFFHQRKKNKISYS